MLRNALGCALLLAALLSSREVRAGGYEMPDLGASALGRGAAFTARADDGMALVYNVAGFARQRGLRLLGSANVIARSYTFARAGAYPDNPDDPATPWGGRRFPEVRGEGPPAVIPTLVVSNDFGLERFVFAAGLITPAAAGGGTFPLGVRGKPNPARYMAVKQEALVVYPSLAVAYRVLDELEVGVAGHLAYGRFSLDNVSSYDTSPSACPNREYRPCDQLTHVDASGTTTALSLGVMAHPSPHVDLGFNARSAHTLSLDAEIDPSPPESLPAKLTPGRGNVRAPFPWVLRSGVRYASRTREELAASREGAWDVELDVTYERWSEASRLSLSAPNLGVVKDLRTSIDNAFNDAVSVRLGGSYGVNDVVQLSAGAFYETSSAEEKFTRAGGAGVFEKLGLTAGVAFFAGPARVDLAYAAVLSPTREVEGGEVRPTNNARQGAPFDSGEGAGALYPSVNDGVHATRAHVLALGISLAFGGGSSAHEAAASSRRAAR